MQSNGRMSARPASAIRWLSQIAAGLVLCVGSTVASATITYTATDLANTTPGQDLWRYRYAVSGPLAAFNSFDIRFSPAALYSTLTASSASSWVNLFVTQPDPVFAADGIVSVIAGPTGLLDGDVDTVDVDFVWLSAAPDAPASQDYDIVDDGFQVIGGGQTRLASTQALPEPGVLALVTLGLLLIGRGNSLFGSRSR
jgi:hypothetical protein